jgi:hypothetical protein
MRRFEVRHPFKASVMGGGLPAGQTVIAALDGSSDVEIQAGELLFSTVQDVRDAGATVTFTRQDTHSKRLFRADAETFWRSVSDVR